MGLDDLTSKAEDLIQGHEDQVEDGVEKAGEIAKDKIGHDDQVDAGVTKIEDVIPGGE
jgi:hypothetical protein